MTTLPTPSLHGTSFATLLDDAMRATDALEAARSALHVASPNARDYSPQQFAAAVGEWSHHYEAVCAALTYVRAHAENASDAA